MLPKPQRARREAVCAVAAALCLSVAAWQSTQFAFAHLPSAAKVPSMGLAARLRIQDVNRRIAHTEMRAYTTAKLATPPEEVMSAKQWDMVPSAAALEYAVVEFSGKQHMVTEGSVYDSSFIRAVPGSKVRLNRVLLLKQQAGQDDFDVTVGQPFVDGAYVDITILEHLKGEDQVVFKHKPKKHYMKRYIVQQKLTRFRIDKIGWDKP